MWRWCVQNLSVFVVRSGGGRGKLIYGFKLSRSPLVPRRHQWWLITQQKLAWINVHFDPLFYWKCKSCQKSPLCRYWQYSNIFADPLNYLLSSFPRPICESLSSQNAKIWIRQLLKFCRPRIRQFLKGKFIPSGLCAVRGRGVNLAGNLFDNCQSRKGWPFTMPD